MRRCARFVAVIAFLMAGGPVLPGEDPHVSLVPWKVLEPGSRVETPLALFWIPASRDELRRSALLTSDELTVFASRCVAMRVVRVDDLSLLAALEVGDELPAVILADADGHVRGRVRAVDGALSVTAVEDMVRDELDARAAAADALLDDAAELTDDGDIERAAAIYERVWEQRCICPRQAKDAERALKKMRRK